MQMESHHRAGAVPSTSVVLIYLIVCKSFLPIDVERDPVQCEALRRKSEMIYLIEVFALFSGSNGRCLTALLPAEPESSEKHYDHQRDRSRIDNRPSNLRVKDAG